MAGPHCHRLNLMMNGRIIFVLQLIDMTKADIMADRGRLLTQNTPPSTIPPRTPIHEEQHIVTMNAIILRAGEVRNITTILPGALNFVAYRTMIGCGTAGRVAPYYTVTKAWKWATTRYQTGAPSECEAAFYSF